MVPPLRSLRLITLDLSGTVFRFNRPIFSTYADVSAKHGVPCQEADIQRGFFKVRILRDKMTCGIGLVTTCSL